MSEKNNQDDTSENKNSGYEESQTRGSLPKKGFFDSLVEKADELKDKSIELGKMAAREAEELGDKIDDAVDDSWEEVKKFKARSSESKNETIDLIERLAKLKEQGILSEKEFNAKKKDLLDKI